MILRFVIIMALFPTYLCFGLVSDPKNNIVEDAQQKFDALCANDINKITHEEYEETVQKLIEALIMLRSQLILQSQREKENTLNNIRGTGECAEDDDEQDTLQATYDLFLYKLYDLSKKGKYGKEFLNQDGFNVKSFEELKRGIERPNKQTCWAPATAWLLDRSYTTRNSRNASCAKPSSLEEFRVESPAKTRAIRP